MALKRNKIENFLNNPLTVRVFDTIDSTNNEAKRSAEANKGSAVLYAADCQTAGRGRRGHDFYSPKNTGLYFTLSLPLYGEPAGIQPITCAAAAAVCEAIAALTDREPQIKWVNDIFIGGKKVAGILAELVLDAQNQPLSVIIGVGVNLTTDRFPAEFAERAAGVGDVEPNRLCAEIVNRLADMYSDMNHSAGNYNSMMEKYKKLNLCLGKRIRYSDRDGSHIALATDIAPDGSLIVTENGIKKSLHSGEISIVFEASPRGEAVSEAD